MSTLTYSSNGFQSFFEELADDTVAAIPVSSAYTIVIGCGEGTQTHFHFFARTTGSPSLATIGIGTSITNEGAVALTGTTGTDGTLNFGTQSGTLYVENRLGAAHEVRLIIIGA